MIPLRDSEEIQTFPVFTLVFIAINAIVFVITRLVAGNAPNPDYALATIYYKYGIIPYTVTRGETIYESLKPYFLTFITSMFMHGSWSHIIFNMLFFWIFGNNIEDYLGHFFFVLFYLGAGIFAAFAHILTNPSSQVPVIGASGAIAGLMGAYMLLFRKSRIKSLVFLFSFVTVIEVPAFVYLLLWFITQIVSGISSFGAATGVAFWAHVGGFVFGLGFAFFAKLIEHGRESSRD